MYVEVLAKAEHCCVDLGHFLLHHYWLGSQAVKPRVTSLYWTGEQRHRCTDCHQMPSSKHASAFYRWGARLRASCSPWRSPCTATEATPSTCPPPSWTARCCTSTACTTSPMSAPPATSAAPTTPQTPHSAALGDPRCLCPTPFSADLTCFHMVGARRALKLMLKPAPVPAVLQGCQLFLGGIWKALQVC